MRTWQWIRRFSQVLIFSCLIYIVWTTRYPLDYFSNPKFFFQLDPLVMFLTAIAERLWLPGLVLSLLTLVVTALLGRVFCGWFCPLGAIQDFIAWLTSRLRRREPEPSAWLNLKYVGLGLLVLLAVVGVQAIWFFDPLAIFVRSFSFNFNPWLNARVDQGFAWLLPLTHFSPSLDAVYNWLKDVVLDQRAPVFAHAGLVFWIFMGIVALVLLRRRFWCRFICPLGALLGLVARHSWLQRDVSACTKACGACRDVCRSNAIHKDNHYHPQECVMCLDCAVECPTDKTAFRFRRLHKVRPAHEPGKLSRAQFLGFLAGGVLASQGCGRRPADTIQTTGVLRPPAALPESEFVQRCVRCGNCMKVCLTNVLQPSLWESGASGIWTPRLEPSLAYCEYHCTLCGQVCPTGAIRKLSETEKLQTKIGLAVVDRAHCIPWAKGKPCLVCEEHCPVAEKAIKRDEFINAQGQRVGRPIVDPALCVGCAICENKCPVRPWRAIRVRPLAQTEIMRPHGG